MGKFEQITRKIRRWCYRHFEDVVEFLNEVGERLEKIPPIGWVISIAGYALCAMVWYRYDGLLAFLFFFLIVKNEVYAIIMMFLGDRVDDLYKDMMQDREEIFELQEEPTKQELDLKIFYMKEEIQVLQREMTDVINRLNLTDER